MFWIYSRAWADTLKEMISGEHEGKLLEILSYPMLYRNGGRHCRWALKIGELPLKGFFSVGEDIEDMSQDTEGFVPQHVFISETEQLTLQAARNLQDLERMVKRG